MESLEGGSMTLHVSVKISSTAVSPWPDSVEISRDALALDNPTAVA